MKIILIALICFNLQANDGILREGLSIPNILKYSKNTLKKDCLNDSLIACNNFAFLFADDNFKFDLYKYACDKGLNDSCINYGLATRKIKVGTN